MNFSKVVSIIILINAFFDCHGQNLIPNPSLEDTIIYQNGYVGVSKWQNVLGSPDYFTSYNSSLWPSSSTPVNSRGSQVAFEGIAYYFIYVYDDRFIDTREYLQVELNETLLANENYHVEFYISLADSFRIAVSENDIGIGFNDSLIPNNFDHKIRSINHFYLSDSSWNPKNKNGWEKFQMNYTAIGGEKFFLIGNFNNDMQVDTSVVNQGGGGFPAHFSGSGYYIDNILVEKLDTVGLEEIVELPKIDIFPNPITNYLSIKYLNVNDISFKIYSLMGKEINVPFHKDRGIIKFDFSMQQSGVYLIQVQGSILNHTYKIVKQ